MCYPMCSNNTNPKKQLESLGCAGIKKIKQCREVYHGVGEKKSREERGSVAGCARALLDLAKKRTNDTKPSGRRFYEFEKVCILTVMLLLRPLYIYSSLLLLLSCLRAGCCMRGWYTHHKRECSALCALRYACAHISESERERRTIEMEIESEREGARVRV